MNIEKYISSHISSQFPSIYREDAQDLVAFMKAYYRFMETTTDQNLYNNRRLFSYRDIDTTLPSLLKFFSSKYLNGVPNEELGTVFLVKNILDFYRRKGSTESIELFFKLFYNEQIEVYYPSYDILKPSDSIWATNSYLEFTPSETTVLSSLTGAFIEGTISKANAIIESVNFIILNETILPVLYLSSLNGSFVNEDRLFSGGSFIGLVRGSLTAIRNLTQSSANNEIGDIVEVSSDTGMSAKARVSKISISGTGELELTLEQGGFGYTANNTNILISEQTIVMQGPQTFQLLEEVAQANSAFGRVIGFSGNEIGIVLNAGSPPFNSNSEIYTTERVSNIDANVVFVSPFNDSASARLGSLTNVTSQEFFVDLISNFLNVPLLSSNYSTVPPALVSMTGVPPITINTVISDAFTPQVYSIGSIGSIVVTNSGEDYIGTTYVLAVDDTIPQQVYDVRINLSSSTILLPLNNTVTQSNGAAGIIVDRSPGVLVVRPISFTPFDSSLSLTLNSTSYPIASLEIDYNSVPSGLNAVITAETTAVDGKIDEVIVTDSGYGFISNQRVNIRNLTRNTGSISAIGLAEITNGGKTDGRWQNFNSHLNYTKRIQDSLYYQDYSYEVGSKLEVSEYEKEFKNSAHVSGMKFFGKMIFDDSINIDTTITMEEQI